MTARSRAAVCLVCIRLLVACEGGGYAEVECHDALAPISEGFGARGPFEVQRESVANPAWPNLEVSVFLPRDGAAPAPVVVFAHANDVADPDAYRGLIDHIVSRGNALVFAPYMVGSAVHAERYAALRAGVKAGVDAHGERLDTRRIGFVGHSYGAGAIPDLAAHARHAWGWGRDGGFVHLMAPWFAIDSAGGDAPPRLPEGTLLLVQVFEDDTANDHRIAIDLLEQLGVPPSDRDYVLVRSDRWGACELAAVHTVPQSTGLRAGDDALDDRAVYRLLDALAAAAWQGDPLGRRVALGAGAAEQVGLGAWPDGTPVRALTAGPSPEPSHAPSQYLFRQAERAGWIAYGGGQ